MMRNRGLDGRVEDHVQTHSPGDPEDVTNAPSAGNADVDDMGALILRQSDESRAAEELRMLFTGFGTGLTIAGVFLIYILLEAAKLLP